MIRVNRLTAAMFAALAVLGPAAAGSLPIDYRLEIAQGHRPSALDAGSPGFDAAGDAVLRAGAKLVVLTPAGAVRGLDLDALARTAIDRDIFKGRGRWDGAWDKGSMVDTGVVFDSRDRAYTIITPRYSNLKQAVLLWSDDQLHSWHAVALAGRNATLEKPDAFNDRDGPPTILSFENYGGISAPRLWLNPLRIDHGAVIAAPPLLLSSRSLLVGNHSGAANSTFTTRDKIFIVYDTTDKSAPGTLSVARQYDRATGKLEGGEMPIGRSTTAVTPDPHDIPAITMGPDGRLIVVIGAHHARFRMFTARAPRTLLAGMTDDGLLGEPRSNGANGSYSYVSLNMAHDGTMNIIARAEGDRAHYQLVQLQKRWKRPWTVWPGGLVHRIIAQPSRPHYAAWRQRVTIGRQGRLYLNFRYFPNELTPLEATGLGIAGGPTRDCANNRCWYPNAPYIAPVTLVSADEGATWR